MSRHDPWSNIPGDEELDDLIRAALQETAGTAEPPAQVWARIRAEVEADRVPIWVAWWRRLQLACADRLPRTMQHAIAFALVLVLASMSFGRMGWFDGRAPLAGTGTPGEQRQIARAEQRFRDHYRVAARSAIPTDIPPKGGKRTPPAPVPFTGPQHLAVGAMNPS